MSISLRKCYIYYVSHIPGLTITKMGMLWTNVSPGQAPKNCHVQTQQTKKRITQGSLAHLICKKECHFPLHSPQLKTEMRPRIYLKRETKFSMFRKMHMNLILL